MKPDIQEFLLQRLQFLRDELRVNGLYENRAGICYAVTYDSTGAPLRRPIDATANLVTLMAEWPKWSGERTFPVPHPEGKCPQLAFYNLPIWEGPYGALRRELLDYLIERLK